MKNFLTFLVLGCVALKGQVTTGLIARYTFDGHSNDISGNNNHGTNNGASPVPGRFGQPNMAYYFDGANDYVFVPNSVSLNPTNAITICAWYKTASFSGNGYSPIFTKGFTSHSSPYYQYKLGVTGSQYSGAASRFGFSVTNNSNILCSIFTPNNYWVSNTWYFIVGVYDGSQVRLYVNNQLVVSQSFSGTLVNFPTNARIGDNTTASDFLKGTLDDVRLYDRALAPFEIAELYNANMPVSNFSSSSNGTVCVGTTVTFSDQSTNAPATWSWSITPSAGVLSNNILSANPTATFSAPGIYTISLQANGSNEFGTVFAQTINVTPSPNLTVGNNVQICLGSSASFLASGANTYTWSNSGGSAAAVTYTPFATTIYTVGGTVNGCSSSTTVSAFVIPLPTVSIVSSKQAVCTGESATFTAIGAFSYTWYPGAQNGSSLIIVPSSATGYTCVGADLNGCTSSNVASIEVLACTGIVQVSASEKPYVLFPNPATDKVKLKANVIESVRADVYLCDASGKSLLERQIVFSGPEYEAELNIEKLAAGIYFIKVVSDMEKSETFKVIKK